MLESTARLSHSVVWSAHQTRTKGPRRRACVSTTDNRQFNKKHRMFFVPFRTVGWKAILFCWLAQRVPLTLLAHLGGLSCHENAVKRGFMFIASHELLGIFSVFWDPRQIWHCRLWHGLKIRGVTPFGQLLNVRLPESKISLLNFSVRVIWRGLKDQIWETRSDQSWLKLGSIESQVASCLSRGKLIRNLCYVCPPHSAKVFEFLQLFQTLVEVSVQVLFRLPSKPSNLFEGPGWCLGWFAGQCSSLLMVLWSNFLCMTSGEQQKPRKPGNYISFQLYKFLSQKTWEWRVHSIAVGACFDFGEV